MISVSSSKTLLTSFLVRPVESLIWAMIWDLVIGSAIAFTRRVVVAVAAFFAAFFFAAIGLLTPFVGDFLE